MDTANPAAGTAHAFFELRDYARDVLCAGFRSFGKNGPANPFVSGERGNVFPFLQGLGVAHERIPQVFW